LVALLLQNRLLFRARIGELTECGLCFCGPIALAS